ncbi:iron chaperone [Curtobacterium sp. Leaf261]|uniref:iron chaperone n=1 Tax=Curtobacterium sp. Leaf261 TaxID=1736311 RepID=UPI0006FA71DE|nr:DUF1801 domain-containing protein [Curtobacterium sp. Leaf261]KQO62776.1 hypothetical protein ASF23_07460 [Curtobacterium sp. Leaf261]
MAPDTFSAAERAAMKAAAAEARTAAKRAKLADKAAAERQDCVDAIAALPDEDRSIVERLHEVVTAAGPDLAPRTWYGMPAYARDGKVVCFVQPASKFGVRYVTLGFQDTAALDDGDLWPTSYAVTAVDDRVGVRVAELVRRAMG